MSEQYIKGVGLVREQPVVRDPRSGQLVIHPAYSGWRPSERKSLLQLLFEFGLACGFLFMVCAMLWRVPG